MTFVDCIGRPLAEGDRVGVAFSKEDIDEFYYKQIAANPGAKMVKLADIDDNLEPWRQSYLPIETQERLAVKYAKARELLGA